MNQTKLKAEEILNYCLEWLNADEQVNKKQYKEMIKEICFIIDNS